MMVSLQADEQKYDPHFATRCCIIQMRMQIVQLTSIVMYSL